MAKKKKRMYGDGGDGEESLRTDMASTIVNRTCCSSLAGNSVNKRSRTKINVEVDEELET